VCSGYVEQLLEAGCGEASALDAGRILHVHVRSGEDGAVRGMVGGRKAGGILVEVTQDKAIAGIGINLTAAPPGAATVDQPRDELLEREAMLEEPDTCDLTPAPCPHYSEVK